MQITIIKYKWLFLFFIFFEANSLLANLRAPWSISRYPSYSLSYSKNNLIVSKENLEFSCDGVYEGDGNIEKITQKKCKVEAVYYIQSDSDTSHLLEFILPSEKMVSVSINGSVIEKVEPKQIQISDLEKEGHRLSDLCRFCEASINKLYSASFVSKFKIGLNSIRIEYEQPLAATEISYGYFKSSKWMNSFSYELWPLKEWKLDPKFEMNIKFTSETGGFLNRLFKNKLVSGCNGFDLRFTKPPGAPFKKQLGQNGAESFFEYNQNLNPSYNLSDKKKTYYEQDKLIYEVSLQEKFPDRLNCYFGHEKN